MRWNKGANPETDSQDLADRGFFMRYLFLENQGAASFGYLGGRFLIRFGQDQYELFPAEAGNKVP